MRKTKDRSADKKEKETTKQKGKATHPVQSSLRFALDQSAALPPVTQKGRSSQRTNSQQQQCSNSEVSNVREQAATPSGYESDA